MARTTNRGFGSSFFPTNWTRGGWFFFLLAPGLLLLDLYELSPSLMPWLDSALPMMDLTETSFFFFQPDQTLVHAWALFTTTFLVCLPVVFALAYFHRSPFLETVLIMGIVLFVSGLIGYTLFDTLAGFMEVTQERWLDYYS